ncbi:hypothetical protein INT43_004104 [Umbelopsis isabellina]|uniref:Carboxylic ester hydrolase n=1 Tax=Mortierella isabellina TaxID=91625 RepID=A0A8H7PCP3_MORIS|nr:hypothetical protein INT43_004104 [Umbelopsis isabellina]
MVVKKIEQGLVKGKEVDGVYSFFGIPYAKLPARWAPPAAPEPWEGVHDGLRFGNAAIQTVHNVKLKAEESEDCLNLNVWSGDVDVDANLPVMVWIHGGGFINWSSSMDEWNGAELSKNKVVVVSMNYRLGPLGFIYHPEAGCNFAVLDWVASLTWVSRNIKQFGGNPDNVTIFGQSAGATAVRALLCTPSAHGLFHKALLISAGFDNYTHVESPSLDRVKHYSDKFFDHLGTHDLAALQQLPINDMKNDFKLFAGIRPQMDQLYTPANLIWCPVQDNKIVHSIETCPKHIPVIFGYTDNEARFFIRPQGIYGQPKIEDVSKVYNAKTLSATASLLGGQNADQIVRQVANLPPYEALDQLLTNAIWKEPALKSFHTFASLSIPSYMYCFARISPANQTSGELASHCCDLPYLFGHVTTGEKYDDTDVHVSEALRYAVTAFTYTGVPRFTNDEPWSKVDPTHPRITILADTIRDEKLIIDPLTKCINPAINL